MLLIEVACFQSSGLSIGIDCLHDVSCLRLLQASFASTAAHRRLADILAWLLPLLTSPAAATGKRSIAPGRVTIPLLA